MCIRDRLIDDSFYLYGRPDYERPGRGIDKRKTPQEITEGMDVSLPVLVIDHEPRELQELADTGVDVDFCGHTHDGQVFPGNIVIRFFWENPCGYLKKGNMHNICLLYTSSIVLHNLLIAVLAFIWLIPIIWLLCTSFSAYSGMNTSTFFPKEWSISNYMKLFHSDSVSQFPQWFLNTFILSLIHI